MFGAAHRAAENGFDEGIKVAVGPTHAYVSRCETADALRLAEKLASEGANAPSIDELIEED